MSHPIVFFKNQTVDGTSDSARTTYASFMDRDQRKDRKARREN
jgi:hypothetical protein